MPLPSLITEVAERCRVAGGRAWLVGGGVRDELLGREVHDWDIEVYGIPEQRLEALLWKVGPVNAVGRSFGVYKLHRGEVELDVSLPRRDSKVGPGHRGIGVSGDPNMEPKEAARRRDLTINAILKDPLTGEILDPWGGQADLRRRILRAVDEETFLEDPLRALRTVQFAARLDFEVDPALVDLCGRAPLHELPSERILGEWSKLLLKGVRPSRGLEVAVASGMWSAVFPATGHASPEALDGFAQEWRSTLQPEGRQLAVGFSLLLRESTDLERALDRLGLHRWQGFAAREQVLAMWSAWTLPLVSDEDLRRASVRVELGLLLRTKACFGEDVPLARTQELGVEWRAPVPLVLGRDLIARGVPPGKAMGRVLEAVYDAQLSGAVATLQEALQMSERLWRDSKGVLE